MECTMTVRQLSGYILVLVFLVVGTGVSEAQVVALGASQTNGKGVS